MTIMIYKKKKYTKKIYNESLLVSIVFLEKTYHRDSMSKITISYSFFLISIIPNIVVDLFLMKKKIK